METAAERAWPRVPHSISRFYVNVFKLPPGVGLLTDPTMGNCTLTCRFHSKAIAFIQPVTPPHITSLSFNPLRIMADWPPGQCVRSYYVPGTIHSA